VIVNELDSRDSGYSFGAAASARRPANPAGPTPTKLITAA